MKNSVPAKLLNNLISKIFRRLSLVKIFSKLYSYIIDIYLFSVKTDKVGLSFKSFDRFIENQDNSKRLRYLLNSQKINVIDIGGRWGHQRIFNNYLEFIDIHISEPEAEERKILEKKKYKVIPFGLWNKTTSKKLYITHKRGNSSVFKSNDKLRSLFWDRKLYAIEKVQNIKVSTINKYCKKKKITPDYLKIDTQGSEFEILKGSDDFYPLLINTEISFEEVYENQKKFFYIYEFLFKRDYMILSLPINPFRTKLNKKGFSKGIPLHGTCLFTLNPFTNTGRKKILQNREKFISLMLIFGHSDFIELCNEIIGEEKFSELILNFKKLPVKKRINKQFEKKEWLGQS